MEKYNKNIETNEIGLSVIIPVFNEEEIISELYERLSNSVAQITSNYELIFINDGSMDNTLSELRNLIAIDDKVFFINFSRNFGHQIAVSAGLDKCKKEVVIIIDGDLQDPPEIIPQMYEKYNEGYEVVYAKRAVRKGETFFKKNTAKMFYRLMRKITSINIPLDTGDFRLMDRKIVDYLKKMPEHNKFLRGQIAWMGFKQTEVSFIREERKFGKTGYSFSKMLHFALDGITSFSNKPLEIVTRLGLAISFVSILIILYAIFSHFILNHTVPGWTSTILSTMFIGGVQLFSIGIIGEYINRININIINRPLYIIESTNIN